MKALAMLGVCLWLTCGSVCAQSLGEVAHKEKDRRQKNSEAGTTIRSYSDRDRDLETLDRTGRSSAPPAEGTKKNTASIDPDAPESVLEVERERALELEPRMAEIAAMADVVDGLYERYEQRCKNRIAAPPPAFVTASVVGVPPGHDVTMDRKWFIVIERAESISDTTAERRAGMVGAGAPPECQGIVKELVNAATDVKTAMMELLETARRQRILPGFIRELRQKYSLE